MNIPAMDGSSTAVIAVFMYNVINRIRWCRFMGGCWGVLKKENNIFLLTTDLLVKARIVRLVGR